VRSSKPASRSPNHLGLGTLYQQIGREQQAQAELTTAAEMYRAMEMPFWLEKTASARGAR
jgi:hypothetical protein